MTTRITLTILLTTWVVLIIGEAGAFYNARQGLLTLFDRDIITRATTSLEMELAGGKPSLLKGDRYTRAEPIAAPQPRQQQTGKLLRTSSKAAFETDGNGNQVRVLRMGFVTVPAEGEGAAYNITYSRPSEQFNQLLEHLKRQLLLISLACGLTTAWVALKLSRDALRPLRETSDIIAKIDERQLGTRIDASKMPVELAPMAKRLNEMLARLQHVFQQRKQFLADAAHELRTPTAALLTTLEVAVRRPRDHAALLEALQSGVADAQRLRRLVESLMEQARSDAPRPTQVAQIDVAHMLHECVQLISPLAGERQISIAIDPRTPAHLPFVTQPERLRSIVLNLLSNAIEYNRAGGSVHVHMESENGARENGNGTLSLTIRDTGIGISAEQLPHVFEPFYRGGAKGDDAQHLGLGLFLVRSHVEALRGQCRIESEPDKGTTMHITLQESPSGVAPVTSTPDAAPETAQASAAAPGR